MKRALWIPLALSGCLPALSSRPSGPHALSCARETTIGLGYEILSDRTEGGVGSFIAQKRLPGGEYYPVTAEVHVAAWGDRRGEYRIKVEGARYEERAPSLQGTPPGVGSAPRLRGGPRTAEVQVGSRRRGRSRLSPGPVAEDVKVIQVRCGSEQDG